MVKCISSASTSDQIALHVSHAARNIFEEPEFRLDPEVAKQQHKWSTKPDVFAWSKILFRVSFTLVVEFVSRTGAEEDALRFWATVDNITVMQAVTSYNTLPEASSLQETTYISTRLEGENGHISSVEPAYSINVSDL